MPVNGQWLVESQLWATIRQNGQGRGEGGGVKGGVRGGEGYEKLKRVIVIKQLIVLVCR